MRFIQTLLAFLGGAAAAALWLDRQTPTERPQPSQPDAAEPRAERTAEPNPDQAAQIERLEAELAELSEQRRRREPPPDEPMPEIDAIRAARARAYELERQLAQQRAGQDQASAPRWQEIEPPAAESLLDAAAAYLPRVAIRAVSPSVDPDVRAAIWSALGALHEFAEACTDHSGAAAWFAFHGDFARWCVESGHPDALPLERLGVDASRPVFPVDARVNRSGEIAVPSYITLVATGGSGGRRLYYVDNAAGETGRMHVVGYA